VPARDWAGDVEAGGLDLQADTRQEGTNNVLQPVVVLTCVPLLSERPVRALPRGDDCEVGLRPADIAHEQ